MSKVYEMLPESVTRRSATVRLRGPRTRSWVWRIVTVIVVGYLLLVVPGERGATVFLIANTAILALFALSTNLLVGHAGIVCFGEAVFYGLGSYAASLISQHMALDALPLLAAAAATGAAAALAVGFITVRIYGMSLAMLTLAIGQICFLYFSTTGSVGGENGLVTLGPSHAAGIDITSQRHLYEFVAVMVVIAAAALYWVYRSPFGLILRVMREDHVRLRYLGINPAAVKVLAFTISGAIAGFAGGLSTFANQIVTPEVFNWTNSGSPVLMSALGGFDSFVGPIFGAGIYSWLTDHLTGGTIDPNLVLGAILIVVVLAVPTGVVRVGERVRNLLAGYRRSHRARRDHA